MESLEPKKLALLRILQILWERSDAGHPLRQGEIAALLERDYGIAVERKAIGRNIALLQEAGFEIENGKGGCYLAARLFEDAELRLLIDGVLASPHISALHSKELIGKVCSLSNRYFPSHAGNIHSVSEWNRTDSQLLFYHIELIDEAIEKGKMVRYEYNKYGVDRKLHKTSVQRISPYQLILHNQRYYLMGYSDYWDHMVYHRMDRITNMAVSELAAALLPGKAPDSPGRERQARVTKKLTALSPERYRTEAAGILRVQDHAGDVIR